MSKSASSATVDDRAASTKRAVDYDRYISRAGLVHLQAKQQQLEVDVAQARQKLRDAKSGSHSDVETIRSAQDRAEMYERDLRDTTAFLRIAIVIEDTPEYQALPDGVVWFGCAVSIEDEEGSGFMALLNHRERENRGSVIDMCRKAKAHSHDCESVEVASCTSVTTQAILGKQVGEIVEFVVNGKAQHLRIVAVTPLLRR